MAHSELINRLAEETSLYLRQHADNPVAWQPWDEAALALACDTGRPILLSIGYSACHWCHVMAHESFEDEDTARVMNELYVNIKVDREERPDLDKIYQLSHQLLTGRGGGWPLTLFLDPQHQIPFFAGTYFPLQARYGMPAFKEVLARARQWFDQNPDEIEVQAGRLRQAIESLQPAPADRSTAEITAAEEDQADALLEKTARELLHRFDRRHGGFGGAPKFPQAPVLELAATLSRSETAGSGDIGEALETTLEKMGNSGLRDHLDGGFFRYCVDDSWTIPHFEKMLYDNAQLLPLYAEAAAASGGEGFARCAAGIVAWLQAEMLQDNGAFSASIDADAGGEEGGFHVWTAEEVREHLADEQYSLLSAAYGLDQPPNFEHKAWHLVGRVESESDPAGLASAREALRVEREKRIHPALDDKQITSWNALTAAGLLRAARAMLRPAWAGLAQATLDFIRDQQWDGERLLAIHNQGRSRFSGYLDDYAFTLQALLESLRTEWRREDLEFALQLADAMLAHFEDKDHGGFFFSDSDQPTPIARTITTQDDAVPAAYSAAVMALHDLAALVGEQRYMDAAGRALERACNDIDKSPLAFASLTRAMLTAARPHPQLVIDGRDQDKALALKQWAESQIPVKCYFLRSSGDAAGEGAGHEEAKNSRPGSLPGILAEFNTDQPVTAWLCTGMTCLPPVHTQQDLQDLLKQHS